MPENPPGFSFKLGGIKKERPADPEALFRSLTSRSAQIQHAWSHQADIWRAYSSEFEDTRDIALELPTGSGKTLIGLVLAEFRRRARQERVLYLCPTRQLANQVGERAVEYGIQAKVILSREYNDLPKYQAGDAVGITTYSGLFNTNPRFSDPHVIILDDAHASEDYIANMWSLQLLRSSKEQLFKDVALLFKDEMGESAASTILDEDTRNEDQQLVYCIPQPLLWGKINSLRDLLNAQLTSSDDELFAWSMVRDHLHACQIYCSWGQILVRPIIPPTLTHVPFANARQRIYMSATLGSGGELERISGVDTIERVPMPLGWENENMGRRLFLFPGIELEDTESMKLVSEAIKVCERGLVIVPTHSDAKAVGNYLRDDGVKILGSADITESLDPFTKERKSALVLANRYDGIDLPGDKCRLLMLQGIPGGVNLQERFLLSRLGAQILFRDRLRTRFTQGVGRCSRGATDYATVIILGQPLYDFCSNIDVTQAMSQMLQAEIRFGIDESTGQDVSSEKLLGLIQHLHRRTKEWEAAETHLQAQTDRFNKKQDVEADLMMKVVALEVKFAYELWKKNYLKAIELGSKITDALQEHKVADSSRSWWHYLTGCASFIAAQELNDKAYKEKSIQLFGNASKCSNGIIWFADTVNRLRATDNTISADYQMIETSVLQASEKAFQQLSMLGFFGPKFDRKMKEYTDQISQTNATQFELALERLGQFLGLESVRFTEAGAPDTIWCLEGHWTIAFEAKSDEDPSSPISLDSTRQLAGHFAWVKNNFAKSKNTRILALMVSPRKTIQPLAINLASEHSELYWVHIDSLRKLFIAVVNVFRTVRGKTGAYNVTEGIKAMSAAFSGTKLDPASILARLSEMPLKKLEKSGP